VIRPRTIAVILGGGVGLRVGLPMPKQLVKVAGRPIIEHTLEVFERHDEVDEIVVVMSPGFSEELHRTVVAAGITKVSAVIEGGSSRNDSTERALDAIAEGGAGDDTLVLIHDAVRPFVDARIISECLAALRHFDAVDVAIPSADTVIEVADNLIVSIPDRARLRRGQTPQGFRLGTLRQAYQLASQDSAFQATDDCGVVLRYLPDVPIRVVEGTEQNMKVTHAIDLFLADKLFQLESCSLPHRSFSDYAAAIEGRTLVVFGGSYGIGADLADLVRSFGGTAMTFSRTATATDVANAEDVRQALLQAQKELGHIDWVVNTAGVLRRGALGDLGSEAIEESLQVNLHGPIHVARESLPYLRESRGKLLLFTSSSYTRGRSGYSIYSAAKAGVVNLTQALADEWMDLGIRVNCMNPERTATPMRRNAFGAEPQGTLLASKDVALSALDVLLSSLTGQVVDVRLEAPTTAVRDTAGEDIVASVRRSASGL
jgi:2-C-methyl-D-erythritol 4-phosphate cytidylyltransferase